MSKGNPSLIPNHYPLSSRLCVRLLAADQVEAALLLRAAGVESHGDVGLRAARHEVVRADGHAALWK